MPTSLVQDYLSELRRIKNSGEGVEETSYYPALSNLLNGVGGLLKPEVRVIMNTKNRGAGIPDGGFFTPNNYDGRPQAGQLPSRGALEVKGTPPALEDILGSKQVKKYLGKYGQVLVTNLRSFAIAEESGENLRIVERYDLAPSEEAFWKAAGRPATLATQEGEGLAEFLKRALIRTARASHPRDVASLLASYAKEARIRLDRLPKNTPALQSLRRVLEELLGVSLLVPKESISSGQPSFKRSSMDCSVPGLSITERTISVHSIGAQRLTNLTLTCYSVSSRS